MRKHISFCKTRRAFTRYCLGRIKPIIELGQLFQNMNLSCTCRIIQIRFRKANFGLNGLYWNLFLKEMIKKSPTETVEDCKILTWCGAGSNRRHMDFQSIALPTELPHLLTSCLSAIRVCKVRQSIPFFKIGF